MELSELPESFANQAITTIYFCFINQRCPNSYRASSYEIDFLTRAAKAAVINGFGKRLWLPQYTALPLPKNCKKRFLPVLQRCAYSPAAGGSILKKTF